jgi:hypothetical protein
MGRCEFPQPRSFSREGGQTDLARRSDRPCPEGAIRLAWLGGSTSLPRILGRVVFEVVSRVVSVLEVVVQVVGLESLQVVSLLGVPRAQYGDGRSRSFEIERRDGPRSSFRGFGPPPVREGWFPRSGFRGGVRGGSFGRKGVLDCANLTFEQMARHWFYSFVY